jgi:hypothetical protein
MLARPGCDSTEEGEHALVCETGPIMLIVRLERCKAVLSYVSQGLQRFCTIIGKKRHALHAHHNRCCFVCR